MEKCQHPGGIDIKPDGVHPIDPCRYVVAGCYRNVTVRVLQCKVCGHIEIEWEKQEDTEEIMEDI